MVKNTLNVGSITEGFVLDHIEAGKSMEIYKYLHLDKLDCCVAIIKNARSNKMGKKDIMKIECPIDFMDLDILGFIDHNITVNIIENKQIVAKKQLTLPKEIRPNVPLLLLMGIHALQHQISSLRESPATFHAFLSPLGLLHLD